MNILFCKSSLIGSVLIRAVTWSKWSHVAVLAADGDTVIEATWPKVRKTTYAKFCKQHPSHQMVSIDVPNEAAGYEWLLTQVGKRYDLSALFGFLFHRNWADDSKWFCSELVAEAIAKGGLTLFRDDAVSRVTPQHLWMLNY